MQDWTSTYICQFFTFRIIPPVISLNIQGHLLRFGKNWTSPKTYRSKTFQTSKEVLLMASEIRRSPVEVGSYWVYNLTDPKPFFLSSLDIPSTVDGSQKSGGSSPFGCLYKTLECSRTIFVKLLDVNPPNSRAYKMLHQPFFWGGEIFGRLKSWGYFPYPFPQTTWRNLRHIFLVLHHQRYSLAHQPGCLVRRVKSSHV